jgi:hypothetical protein
MNMKKNMSYLLVIAFLIGSTLACGTNNAVTNPTPTFTPVPTITLAPTVPLVPTIPPVPTVPPVPTATSFSDGIESALISQGYTCKELTCTDADATITINDKVLTMVIDPTIENGAAAEREYALIGNALNKLYVPSFASALNKDVQIALNQPPRSNSPTTYFADIIDGCPLAITMHWNQSKTGMDKITIALTIVEKLILK